jgi:O-antigen ligase
VGKKIKDAGISTNTILLGVFLVTVYFKTNSADPFNTPKLLVFAILSGILIGPLLYSYYFQKVKRKSAEFVGTVLSVVFIFALTWALINTDVFVRGFIGDTQRRNGFLQYLFLMILFLYLIRFTTIELAKKLIKTIPWVGLVVGSYGMLQILGKDFVEWNNPYNSMISTMGNPNFSSAILACFASVSVISIFMINCSLTLKMLAGLGSLISFYAIVKSESRQGLVIIFITLSIFVSIKIFTRNHKLGIVVIISNLLINLMGILGMLQIGPLQNILYKESVSVRGYYWRAGIEMFKDNPLTGVGLDSYLTSFFKFREPGYPANYGFDITSSNAHNVVIQLFATGGIFVGISYLLLLALVLFCGFRLISKVNYELKNYCIILLAAWIGLQAQSIISIDFIALSVWSWLFGGLIVGLYNKVNAQQEIEQSQKNINRVKLNRYYVSRIISILFLIPIIIISVFLNRVEEQTFNSAALKSSDQKNLVLNNAERMFENPLADPFYKFQVSLHLMDSGYFEKGVDNIRFLSRLDPQQADYLKLLERVAMSSKDLKSAAELRESIALLDPWNAKNYFELGLIYKELGEIQQMNRVKNIVISIGTSRSYSDLAQLELNS